MAGRAYTLGKPTRLHRCQQSSAGSLGQQDPCCRPIGITKQIREFRKNEIEQIGQPLLEVCAPLYRTLTMPDQTFYPEKRS